MSISILDYSAFCLAQPRDFIGCGLFWFSCIVVAEIFLITFMFVTIRKLLRERREWREFYQRLADREKVADPEVMEKHIWRGE